MTLEDDLMTLARLKQTAKETQEEFEEVQKRVISTLERTGKKSITANDRNLRGTLVKGSTMVLDDEALKKTLGAKIWNKITKRVLDKEKLEAHIVTGEVDKHLVAQCTTEKDSKPYIRLSGTHVPQDPPKAAKKTTASAKKRVVKPKKK